MRASLCLVSLAAIGCVASPDPASIGSAPSFANDLNNVVGESVGGLGVLQGFPYPRLTVYVAEPEVLDSATFETEVWAALREWERASQGRRTFREASDPSSAHIVIQTSAARHVVGCDSGFSNPQGTIAHAYTWDISCQAGSIHLNAGLPLVMNGTNRVGSYDVRTTVLHEVGHLLGLGHSPDPGHIMHWEYTGIVRRLTTQESLDIQNVLSQMEAP